MRILFITSRFPYPPLRGDQAIPYHRLRHLSKKHEVTLLSFYESDTELAGLDHLRPFCKRIYTVHISKWQSVLNVAFYGFFSPLPLQVLYYRSDSFKKLLKKLVAENNFDLIHTYLLRLAPYLAEVAAPKVLELIDSMQLNWARRVEVEKFPKRWFYQEELRRLILYERTIGNYFNQMIVVSQRDRDLLPASNVEVIPLGVDTEAFKPARHESKKNSIIFSGNMGYSPNIKAVAWFAEKCLPTIQASVPDVSFTILGTNPSKEVCALAQRKGIAVTGFVKSMPEALARASISIAPMLSGSGMQFKILEAMACGLPVVTTTLGLGDIKATQNKEICIADTAEEFVEIVLTLLNSSEMSTKIGKNARNFVVNNHSWESVSSKVEEIYFHILKTI